MRSLLLVVVLLVVVGCNGSAGTETTVSSTAATSTSTTLAVTTTATASITTTTQPVTTTSVSDLSLADYPANPETLEDIPETLVAYIGAAMPDPDLTITGPEDLDRWMSGWLDWLAWTHANPTEGSEQLEVNMVPGTDQFAALQAALVERAEAGNHLLGGGFLLVSLSGTFDEFFEDKSALRITIVAQSPPSYLVDGDGNVVSVFDALEGEVTVSALLRYDPERDEWLMETFEVLGRS